MTTNQSTTLEALNAYEARIKLWEADPTHTDMTAAIEGANIWQDVIYYAMDVDATAARWGDDNSDDFIGTDGLHYHYAPSAFNGPWIILDD